MDTREKILALEAVPALLKSGEWVIVVGQFDPLTVVQAKRLATLAANGSKLLAIVLEDAQALLPANARAALVAALRNVDAVTVAEPGRWTAVTPNGTRAAVIEDAEAERGRSAEFVRYLLERQAAPSPGGRSQ